jgi:internalin A
MAVGSTYKYDIFLSYSSDDVEWAEKLEADLKARDLAVYRDKRRLIPGTSWEPQLDDAMTESHHLVVLWSEMARAGDWVMREAGRFDSRKYTGGGARSDTLMFFICLDTDNRAFADIQMIKELKSEGVYDAGFSQLAGNARYEKAWQKVVTAIVGAVTGPGLSRPVRESLRTGPPTPSDAITYCVSYAWTDESKGIVDRLCREAEERGKKILRDKTGLGLGESITNIMKKLGAGDRVFVILSDKYLKSEYCMFELYEVWRNCRMDVEKFRRRIRVFRLPDAAMSSPYERALRAKFWKDENEKLDRILREHGADLLGQADFRRYKLSLQFARDVGDMLALIADTLVPRDFDELTKYGFADETR